MAIVKIVPKEDWKILRKYINGGIFTSGMVLVPEKVYEKEDDGEVKQFLQAINGKAIDYDFGGDADVWVDVILESSHTFICHIEDTLKEKKGDD